MSRTSADAPNAPEALATLIDGAYGIGGSDEAWLTGLLVAAKPLLDRGLGVVGFFYDLTDPDRPIVQSPVFVGTPDGLPEAIARLQEIVPPRVMSTFLRPIASCATLSERLGLGEGLRHDVLHASTLGVIGVTDFLSIAFTDRSGRGCLVGAPLPRIASASEVIAGREDEWAAFAAHVTAGMRERLAPERDDDDVLRDVATDGWSVVDDIDHGGERYVLARRGIERGEQGHGPAITFSRREHEVAIRAARGQSNKAIGYELGIAPSTVAGHLAKIAEKLGVTTRVELIQALGRALQASATPSA